MLRRAVRQCAARGHLRRQVVGRVLETQVADKDFALAAGAGRDDQFERGDILLATIYIVGSVLLSLAGLWMGMLAMRVIA